MIVQGHKPNSYEEKLEIICWHCAKTFTTEITYNLLSYGLIDCPHCKTTNEVGD